MGEAKKVKRNPSVTRSALLMSAGTMFSRLLGLVRDIVLTSYFSRTVTDAFLVAFRLPNMFRRLFGEGALSVSFIPIYIEQLHLKSGETEAEAQLRAKKLVSSVYSLLMAVISVLSVLGILFMPNIIQVLVGGEGYQAVEGKLSLTIYLGQIMFAYLFLVCNYAFFMAVLNAHKYFGLPALAPALFNFTLIVFALLPGEWSHTQGQFLAYGVLAGGFVQCLVVMALIHRLKLWPSLVWPSIESQLKKVITNFIPGVLGMGILQIMGLVNVNFASRLKEGAHSYIYLADRVLELPQSLIAISLGSALLPTLSELWASKNKEQLVKTGQSYMRLLVFLALPCALGLFFLAEPIVKVLFQRKQFDAYDVQMTCLVLQTYAFLLVASGLSKVIVPNFYAQKNTQLPAIISACVLVIHVIVAHFSVNLWGLQGLVGATVLSGWLNCFILLVVYSKKIGSLQVKLWLKSATTVFPGLVMMFTFLYFVSPMIRKYSASILGNAEFVGLFMNIGFAAIIYLGTAYILKSPEADMLFSRFRRFSRKTNSRN